MLTVGIVLFAVETIATNSFQQDCNNKKSLYHFYDFCVYYCGGKIAASSERTSLYDASVQHRYLATVRGTDPMSVDTVVMQYPPFAACLLIPLALLTPDQAFAAYCLASLLAYLAGFYLLSRICFDQLKLWKKATISFALLGTLPVFITAMLGQMSFFVFFLAAAYFYCLLKNKNIIAGILLALSSFKPHYALFWAAPALGLRRWQALIAATLTEIALLVMACMILGVEAVAKYPALVLRSDNLSSNSEIEMLMISLRGLLVTIFHLPAVFPVTAAVMLLALVFMTVQWWKSGKNIDAETFKKLTAATVILCLFTSVHTFIYDAVVLILPALLIVSSDWIRSSAAGRFLVAAIWATPYIQWLGLRLLPYNLHRSLPTSLILLALSAVIVFNLLTGRNSKSAAADLS